MRILLRVCLSARGTHFVLAMEDTAKLAITAGKLQLCLNVSGVRCRGTDPPV